MQLNINQGEPHKDQLGKVCLNQTNSDSCTNVMLFEANC